jgi:hypothetical protein
MSYSSSSLGQLRPLGPAQSDLLLDFCGRPSGTALPQPTEVSPLPEPQRLDNILWERLSVGPVPRHPDDDRVTRRSGQ